MSATEQSALERAIARREREYSSAIDRLREIAPDNAENEVYELTSVLRESIALVGCLRRLTRGRTVTELHAAFGAPGDFGYETPVGEALSATYRRNLQRELAPTHTGIPGVCEAGEDGVAASDVAQALQFLLTRIGSWTSARWDQHLRHEFGDERANEAIRWLAERGVRPYIPEDVGGPLLQASVAAGASR